MKLSRRGKYLALHVAYENLGEDATYIEENPVREAMAKLLFPVGEYLYFTKNEEFLDMMIGKDYLRTVEDLRIQLNDVLGHCPFLDLSFWINAIAAYETDVALLKGKQDPED